MYYKLNNIHLYRIKDRNYICVGNVGEWDENGKFIRFVGMEEAFKIVDGGVIDPNLHLKSKKDKQKEIPTFDDAEEIKF